MVGNSILRIIDAIDDTYKVRISVEILMNFLWISANATAQY